MFLSLLKLGHNFLSSTCFRGARNLGQNLFFCFFKNLALEFGKGQVYHQFELAT
jgi:hypothetical protein